MREKIQTCDKTKLQNKYKGNKQQNKSIETIK